MSNPRVTCKQPLSKTRVTYLLDVHVCASGSQVKGDWQVKCYSDKCGMSRNCSVTCHRKIKQLLGKPEIDHYSGNGRMFNTLVYCAFMMKCLEVKVSCTVNFIGVFVL